MEFLLQVEKFLALTLHHTADRYSCPAAYHLGNIVGSNLFAYHSLATLRALQLFLGVLDIFFESSQFRVSDLCHTLVVAFTFHALSLKLQVLNLLLVLLNFIDEVFLSFPFCTEVAFLVLQLGNLLVELLNLRLVVLAFDGLTLYLQLL